MPNQLTVVSYNIRHALNMEGSVRLDKIADTLKACLVRFPAVAESDVNDNVSGTPFRSSVICLQEVDSLSPRSYFRRQAHVLARMLSMQCIFARTMSFAGVFGFGNAILTNCFVHSTWNIRLPVKGAEPRKLMYASLDLKSPHQTEEGADPGIGKQGSASTFHVFNTHFGLDSQQRNYAAELSSKKVRTIGGYPPIIFCGDLNTGIDSDEVQILLASTGLSSIGYEREMPTYPSDHPAHRIDHILYSNQLRLDGVRLVRSHASDHLPLIADFSIIR